MKHPYCLPSLVKEGLGRKAPWGPRPFTGEVILNSGITPP